MFCEKIELTFQNWEISPKSLISSFCWKIRDCSTERALSLALNSNPRLQSSGAPSCQSAALRVASGSHFCHLPEAVGTWASGLSLQVTVAYDFTLLVWFPGMILTVMLSTLNSTQRWIWPGANAQGFLFLWKRIKILGPHLLCAVKILG